MLSLAEVLVPTPGITHVYVTILVLLLANVGAALNKNLSPLLTDSPEVVTLTAVNLPHDDVLSVGSDFLQLLNKIIEQRKKVKMFF